MNFNYRENIDKAVNQLTEHCINLRSTVMSLKLSFSHSLLLIFFINLNGSFLLSSEQVKFPDKVNAFLKEYCISCHGPNKKKGGLRIDTLSQDLVGGAHGEDWHEVLNALNKGEMPPEKEKQPKREDLNAVIDILTLKFDEAKAKLKNTGGKVIMRRLTNYEYNNTLNDLLALNEDWSKDFPPDSVSEEGFKNNGFYMGISSMQLDSYLEAAIRALDEAVYPAAQPKLKTIDSKDVTSLKTREGKEAHMPGGLGTIYWKDYPAAGQVVVDLVLSGDIDLEKLESQAKLAAGSRLSVKKGNRTVFATADVQEEPIASRQGGNIHLQYRIPKIEVYPRVSENNPIAEYVFNFEVEGARSFKNFKIVSMKAKGPYFEAWPPESHKRIFIPSKNEKNEALYVREILTSFSTRAWRRPVFDSEIKELYDIYKNKRKSASFTDSVKDALLSVLVSPHFLYLVEKKSSTGKREALSSHELASRMSYFLWSSKPDEKLFQLAESGKLNSSEALRSEVKRLLKDRRSWNFAEQFSSQWLGLEKMSNIAVSPEIYPQFKEELLGDMKKETQYFFAHVLHENLSAMNFIDSDFTFLSDRLKSHYTNSSKGASGSKKMKKVTLDEKLNRGGILAHASIHLANSDGEDSHAINRAVWLVDKIIGNPPPPPPADVEFDTDVEGFDKLSLKEQLKVHVEKESCARCHLKFDPYGVAFENYDAVGGFRTKVKKLNEKELAKRLASATSNNPEITFKKIDTDGNGVVSKEEWVKHSYGSRKLNAKDAQRLDKAWYGLAGVRADKRGMNDTHPHNTMSLDEYKNHIAENERKAIKKIESSLPYLYVNADSNTILPDSTKINGLASLKSYLLKEKKNEIAENLVRRLLSYGLGRSLEFTDEDTVKKLSEKFKANNFKLASLVEEIILTETFRSK